MKHLLLLLAISIVSCSTDDSITEVEEAVCSTDYAVGTCSSGGSFGSIGDTRSMVFSVSNIQDGDVCGFITVLIVKPDTDYLLTTIPEASDIIDICGFSVPTNNGDWDIVDLGTIIYLSSTVDITSESVVELQFECIDYVLNETPQIIGTVIIDSGGDSNSNNNTWQQTFVLN